MFRFYLNEKIDLSLNGIKFPEVVAFDIDAIESEENAVYLNYGLEADYEGKDVKGKIILTKLYGRVLNMHLKNVLVLVKVKKSPYHYMYGFKPVKRN